MVVVGSAIDDDGCVDAVINDGGVVNGVGSASRSCCALGAVVDRACLKNRGGNACRWVPCVRFNDFSRSRSSSLVFRGTPRPEPGNCFVTRSQSIGPDAD